MPGDTRSPSTALSLGEWAEVRGSSLSTPQDRTRRHLVKGHSFLHERCRTPQVSLRSLDAIVEFSAVTLTSEVPKIIAFTWKIKDLKATTMGTLEVQAAESPFKLSIKQDEALD